MRMFKHRAKRGMGAAHRNAQLPVGKELEAGPCATEAGTLYIEARRVHTWEDPRALSFPCEACRHPGRVIGNRVHGFFYTNPPRQMCRRNLSLCSLFGKFSDLAVNFDRILYSADFPPKIRALLAGRVKDSSMPLPRNCKRDLQSITYKCARVCEQQHGWLWARAGQICHILRPTSNTSYVVCGRQKRVRSEAMRRQLYVWAARYALSDAFALHLWLGGGDARRPHARQRRQDGAQPCAAGCRV